ncbi:hypothetical protein GQ457_07G031980 [Hibiscus cannabinus]
MQDKDNITSPLGRLIKDGVVFQQNACVRSFEIDPEYKMSTKAIMNYLQETSVNYFKNVGLQVDTSFGITPGMRKMELVWVFRDMRVEVDQYPWVKLLRYSTGFVHRELVCVLSGSSLTSTQAKLDLAVMMNKRTRKACKLPEEVKEEIKPYLTVESDPMVEAQRYPVPRIETMDHVISGLTTTPDSIICSHELWKINFQYRKECLKDDVIQSLSRVTTNDRGVELEHLLRLDSGIQVLRATTAWRPRA